MNRYDYICLRIRYYKIRCPACFTFSINREYLNIWFIFSKKYGIYGVIQISFLCEFKFGYDAIEEKNLILAVSGRTVNQ